MSLFGRLFDFDGDGSMSSLEKAVEFSFIHNMYEKDVQLTELQLSGLDPVDLEFMDSEERRITLEEAGLDPDEYDF